MIDRSQRDLPRFGDLQGRNYYALPLKPPFSITNLSTALFPLRANMDSLQAFCNNYLNVIPKELGRFRAFSPYVMLMVLDYGQLALDVTNLGWFSQHEICFCVPVEWYKVVRGKWVFHDWAIVTPFIFVDDDLSLPMGRTVVGWPKTFVNMKPVFNNWLSKPLGPTAEMTVSAMVFPELYAGKHQEERVFLEVERDAPVSNMRLPFNAESPIMPWMIANNMAQSMAGMGRDAMNLLNGFGLIPMNEGTSPEKYLTILRNIGKMADPLHPSVKANILNFKQFRSSEQPDRYCYQALTNGYMDFTKFNSVALMGEQAMFGGDLSGGYSIKLHEWPSIPITRTLGLDVHRRWKGDGVDVVQLKPVMPFWYDCNMTYGLGYNLAWRTREGIWHDQAGRAFQPDTPDGQVTEIDKLYNTMLGPQAKPIAGPFRFSGTTIRVMPLLALREKLQDFLNGYLNNPLVPARERFMLWVPEADLDPHAYVYMTATSFGDTTSGTNNVGDWADRELAFMIPVKRERLDPDGQWHLAGVGLVPAFTYVDNVTAAIAGSEVLGIPTMNATFVETDSSWMSADGPAIDAEQVLLRVKAEILPAVGEGEKAERRQIVEISAGTPVDLTGGLAWRVTGDRWASVLRGELERKKTTRKKHKRSVKRARALALQILGDSVPISIYTMKQFRDNKDPDQACYQSIVRIERTLSEVLDLREIEEPMFVRINDFPTQSIVDLLGLVAKPIPGDGVGLGYAVQPIRPFWMRVTMDEALGEPLFYRASTHLWTRDELTAPSFFEEEEPYISVGEDVARIQDEGDPRRMTKAAQDWQARLRSGATAHDISVLNALEAIERIDPQIVIETILSREWGNWNEHARWREGRLALVAAYEKNLSGVDIVHRVKAERGFFTEVLRQLGKRPGEPPVAAANMVRQLNKFTRIRESLEKDWSVLVEWALQRMYPREFPPPAEPPSAVEVCTAILTFIDDIERIATLAVKGEPSAPDNRVDFAERDNGSRMSEMLTHPLLPLRDRIQSLPAGKAAAAIVKKNREAAAIQEKLDETDWETAAMAAPTVPIVMSAPPRARVKKLPSVVASAIDAGLAGEPSQAFLLVMESVWKESESFRDAVALARQRVVLQREALFNQICKAYQKPDFCVRRDSAGPEEERLFPRSESWDQDWYVGREITQAHVDDDSSPLGRSLRSRKRGRRK